MRTSFYIIIAVLLLSGISGCFYSDTDMFYVEPVAGDPPLITVSTSLDTLHNPPVNDSLEMEYLVEITGGEFYYVYAGIAGALIFESDTSQAAFWITPYMADSAGIDTLYMEFYYSSNTNSLADMFGYEVRVKKLSYALDFNLAAAK